MKENVVKLPIHSALIPVFYQKFHCLAQDCRDTCCVDWNITFDKKDYLRLRRLNVSGELRDKLEKDVIRERKTDHEGPFYAKFDLKSHGGRCPFLAPDGLCSIQCACGGDALPDVCKTYPRSVKYTPYAKEYALSPSCEGVLQQLWELPGGVEFVEDPLPKTEWKDANVSRGENLLLHFGPIRALCVDILQNRVMPLNERMLFLGFALQRLQKEDWTDFDPDGWVEQTAALAASDMTANTAMGTSGNRDMYLVQNFQALDAIAATGKRWPLDLYRALKVTRNFAAVGGGGTARAVNLSRGAYAEALAKFEAAFSDRAYFFENLMVAVACFLNFPNLFSREGLWKSYVALCSLYSFYRFVAVLGCKDNAVKERLFHMIVMASRDTLHGWDRFCGFQEKFFQHDSATLAHMAILLNG